MNNQHDEQVSRLTSDEYHAQLARRIAESGQAITVVADVVQGLDVAYTIGNHERRLPELLAFGPKHALMPLLDKLGRMMRETGRPFVDGELVDLGGQYPVMVVRAINQAAAAYAAQAPQYRPYVATATTIDSLI